MILDFSFDNVCVVVFLRLDNILPLEGSRPGFDQKKPSKPTEKELWK